MKVYGFGKRLKKVCKKTLAAKLLHVFLVLKIEFPCRVGLAFFFRFHDYITLKTNKSLYIFRPLLVFHIKQSILPDFAILFPRLRCPNINKAHNLIFNRIKLSLPF